jgi:TPP-dependent pyruvate/acetoin dehydrogenase alpha subunit
VRPGITDDTKRRVFATALRIRLLEDLVAEAHQKGEIQTPTHLYQGQEGIAAAACEYLRQTDPLFGYYRSHGWYLAKGGDLKALVAELFGKSTGCSSGFGGSMHLIDLTAGFQGTSTTVAGHIPQSVGGALALQYQRRNAIVVSCFGDGATEEGVFQESLMFAALRKLPIIFICENNGLACVTPIERRQPAVPIWQRAKACGVESWRVEAQDTEAVCLAMAEAVRRTRAGEGPILLECGIERFAAHCEIPGVPPRRTGLEIAPNDPLVLMSAWVTAAERTALIAQIRRELDQAVAFARSSPFPTELEPQPCMAGGIR